MKEYNVSYKEFEKIISANKEQIKGKNVLLLCDYPNTSEAFKYLKDNYNYLNLKNINVVFTFYDIDLPQYLYTYDGKELKKQMIQGHGDIRNNGVIDIIEASDVVISQPEKYHFSLVFEILYFFNKKFLILCENLQAKYVCKNNNNVEIEKNIPIIFKSKSGEEIELKNCRWIKNF